MMTFSIRPVRSSSAPRTALAIRTRVVCWKEAADRKLFLDSEVSVMPMTSLSTLAGTPPASLAAAFSCAELDIVHDHAFGEIGVASVGDAAAGEHLLDDDLDVLPGDGLALELVDLADFGDDVVLGALFPAVFEDLVDISRSVGQEVAFLDACRRP